MARRASRALQVEGAERLREISRRLRQLEDGREYRRVMTRELRSAGNTIVRAERAAVRALPSRGLSAARGRRSLRQSIARATRMQVRTGGRNPRLKIFVDPAKMPDGQRTVPAYMEGEEAPWRHPVFGNDEKWVSQEKRPWFWRTADQHMAAVERAMLNTLREMEELIERAADG